MNASQETELLCLRKIRDDALQDWKDARDYELSNKIRTTKPKMAKYKLLVAEKALLSYEKKIDSLNNVNSRAFQKEYARRKNAVSETELKIEFLVNQAYRVAHGASDADLILLKTVNTQLGIERGFLAGRKSSLAKFEEKHGLEAATSNDLVAEVEVKQPSSIIPDDLAFLVSPSHERVVAGDKITTELSLDDLR